MCVEKHVWTVYFVEHHNICATSRVASVGRTATVSSWPETMQQQLSCTKELPQLFELEVFPIWGFYHSLSYYVLDLAIVTPIFQRKSTSLRGLKQSFLSYCIPRITSSHNNIATGDVWLQQQHNNLIATSGDRLKDTASAFYPPSSVSLSMITIQALLINWQWRVINHRVVKIFLVQF